MSRSKTIIFFVLCLTFAAWTAPVSFENALHIAENTSKSKKLKLKHKAIHKKHKAQKTTEEPLLYIFQNDENKGFVIIAGDDVFKPVIGVVQNGTYDSLNIPPNFAWYLDNIKKEMAFALEDELEQTPQIAKEWVALAANDSYTAGTYLLTTTWSQKAPFYNQTPAINGQQAQTGCVATAMAQIMKYHEYPERATGTIPAYTTKTKSINIPPVNLEDIAFSWADMKDNYSAYTPAEVNAVATLMSVVGKSVKMDYDTSGSGAYLSDALIALKDYFGYDKKISYINRNNFTDNWITMLKEQIDSYLPVLYEGQGTGGHVFILDGYDNGDNFHINWGWGGLYDGFFTLSNLTPEKHNYNSLQGAVIDIKPAYEASTHYVKFDLNGGSGATPANITDIMHGNTLSESQKPPTEGFTKSEYVNDGKWYIRMETASDTLDTVVIYTEGFENNAIQWYLGSGTAQTNKWYIFDNFGHSGYSSMAISNGTGYTYNTSSPSISHLQSDITFPVSDNDFTLTFYFRGGGELDRDYMTVRYVNDLNSRPVEGSVFDAGTKVGTDYWNNSNWTQKTITLPAAVFSGRTMKLVFTWINNDSGGSQAPAAIDDIKITTLLPKNTYTYKEFVFGSGGTALTDNTTLYLKWIPAYTVIFNASGGTVSPAFGSVGNGLTLASLPIPTRNDYTFNGWFTAEAGGAEVTTSTIFSENTIIYAQWTPIITAIFQNKETILLSNLPNNTKIDVYNLQGKRIYSTYSENSKNLKIQVPTGMYIIKAGNQTIRTVVR